MLMKVGDFCDRVERDLSGLVDELCFLTNRNSENEISSWNKSLPELSVVLSNEKLKDFHISLEYKLPAASAWCDAVLLGYGDKNPIAVMIEIKDWDTRATAAAKSENLVTHKGSTYSHPSDQVRGYVEYCKNFHSAFINKKAEITGCVFFTSTSDLSVLKKDPYKNLTLDYPIFSSKNFEEKERFADYLASKFKKPGYDFARYFERGEYAQSRNLVEQIAKYITDEDTTMFVLLDEQRKGFELCRTKLKELLSPKTNNDEKAIVIIEGPPGSGKSVLAAQLWAALIEDPDIKGSVVMTSTSIAQNSNWEKLFQKQSKLQEASGVIIKSNQFNPGLTSKWIKAKRNEGHELSINDWKNNVKLFLEENDNKMPDNTFEVSIVDEAHALIDPSREGRSGVRNSGWCMQAGPQGYHIMRSSKISIFLMDSEQSYRDNETTRKQDLISWANKLGIKDVEEISLGDAQYRCGGSKDYVSWLESLLFNKKENIDNLSWRKRADGSGNFKFEVVDTPAELDEKLNSLHEAGNSVRLVSSYGRQWKTKSITNPHGLKPEEKDFFIPYKEDGSNKNWSRIWNHIPKNKHYYYYIQAPEGSKMHDDPICEVGCPYVVRGFDYDYLGVLWLNDLVWRNDHWEANCENIYESAWNITLGRARKEEKNNNFGEGTKELIHNLQKGYRVLLSRAIKGIFLWFEDEETREYIESILNGKKGIK